MLLNYVVGAYIHNYVQYRLDRVRIHVRSTEYAYHFVCNVTEYLFGPLVARVLVLLWAVKAHRLEENPKTMSIMPRDILLPLLLPPEGATAGPSCSRLCHLQCLSVVDLQTQFVTFSPEFGIWTWLATDLASSLTNPSHSCQQSLHISTNLLHFS